MPRPAALLCLLLALVAHPLRQAEAASDLARAHAPLLAPTGAIEIPDGGVGDDAGDATLKSGTSHATAPAWGPACDQGKAAANLPHAVLLGPTSPDPDSLRRRARSAIWRPPGACRRQAWLQTFLF